MRDLTKNNFKIQNVAIYHTGALGDLLVSTAALHESLHFFPNAQFTLIGSKLWKEILIPKIWPNIKYIFETNNKNFTEIKVLKADYENNRWTESALISPTHFLKNIDVTIDFRTESLRFAWRTWLAKVPIRVGGNKSIFAKLFFTHFTQEKKTQNIHEKERYLNILSSLHPQEITQKIEYWREHGLPNLIEHRTITTNDTVLINPTASIREKAWSSKNFRALALKLHEKGQKISIIGSSTETEWLQEVAGHDFEIIQPLNIKNMIEIVANAKLLITNTSSMQFVAAGTKTPTLTLIGSAKAEKWGPLGRWSTYIKGKELLIQKPLFADRKDLDKLREILSYNSISVDDVALKAKNFI